MDNAYTTNHVYLVVLLKPFKEVAANVLTYFRNIALVKSRNLSPFYFGDGRIQTLVLTMNGVPV